MGPTINLRLSRPILKAHFCNMCHTLCIDTCVGEFQWSENNPIQSAFTLPDWRNSATEQTKMSIIWCFIIKMLLQTRLSESKIERLLDAFREIAEIGDSPSDRKYVTILHWGRYSLSIEWFSKSIQVLHYICTLWSVKYIITQLKNAYFRFPSIFPTYLS